MRCQTKVDHFCKRSCMSCALILLSRAEYRGVPLLDEIKGGCVSPSSFPIENRSSVVLVRSVSTSVKSFNKFCMTVFNNPREHAACSAAPSKLGERFRSPHKSKFSICSRSVVFIGCIWDTYGFTMSKSKTPCADLDVSIGVF